MKHPYLYILILFYLAPIKIYSQIDFNSQLYNQIIFEKSEIYDSNFIAIDKGEIFNKFFFVDSVSTCFGLPPVKFVNNIFWGVEKHDVVKTEKLFDTITNKINPRFLDFIYIIRTEAGEYTGKTKFAFTVKKKIIDSLGIISYSKASKKEVDSFAEQNWVIEKMTVYNKELYLDKCLRSYNLSFEKEGAFEQLYSLNSICKAFSAKQMNQSFKYELFSDSIIYEIPINKGYWNLDNGNIYLINNEGTSMLTYKYRFKDKNTLVLKYENYMQIWLKQENENE